MTCRRKPYALMVLSSMDLTKRKDAAAVREVLRLAKEVGAWQRVWVR